MESIAIRQLSVSDLPSVEKLLKEEYCAREPIVSHLRVPPEDFWLGIQPVVLNCLQMDISYGAFDKGDGSLCGMALNILGTNATQPNLHLPYPLCMKQFIQLMEEVGLNEYVADTGMNYVEIHVLCVKGEYAKRGIATNLCEISIVKARKKACEYVAILCASGYTRKIAERLGFKVIREIVYKDYVDPLTKEMVLKGMPNPHYAATLQSLSL